jgi:hypothetical protein
VRRDCHNNIYANLHTVRVNLRQMDDQMRLYYTGVYMECEAWGSVAALLVGRSRDRSQVVSLGIFSVVPSDKTMCPEVDSASESEYQGFLPG